MKKFLIIGNKNALGYKEVFPLLREKKVWLGYNEIKGFINNNEINYNIAGLAKWFTNLPVSKNKVLRLTKRYTAEEYPKYDNYDAIEVSKVADIPADYEGYMGVPITILNYLCEGYIHAENHNYELIDNINYGKIKGENKYRRFIIKEVK